VSDIYLTTAATDGGEPATPFYAGPSLPLERAVLKHGRGPERGVKFEQFVMV
jgi:hypothetical protein